MIFCELLFFFCEIFNKIYNKYFFIKFIEFGIIYVYVIFVMFNNMYLKMDKKKELNLRLGKYFI